MIEAAGGQPMVVLPGIATRMDEAIAKGHGQDDLAAIGAEVVASEGRPLIRPLAAASVGRWVRSCAATRYLVAQAFRPAVAQQQTAKPARALHQGQRAGRSRSRTSASSTAPARRRAKTRRSSFATAHIASVGAADIDRAARRRHRHRLDRQERHPRSRDDARAPVLLDRPRRLRTARRQLLASLSRRRRDDDAHGREHQRDHGHQSSAAGLRPARCLARRSTRPRHTSTVRARSCRCTRSRAPTRPGGTSPTGPTRDRRR